MPEIVINTGPIIALVAATGSLEWLSQLYTRVWIPQEVQEELAAGGPGVPELEALRHAGDVILIQPASPTLQDYGSEHAKPVSLIRDHP